ncbi:MAG TPA: response regulator transcription factor [Blastocatellia bacterium]|nr:response regulator transcription factor [Blastocatellia bacterium]
MAILLVDDEQANLPREVDRFNAQHAIGVLVADDHESMRQKVVSTLETEFNVVGAVGDGKEMLDAESRIRPDVVILDISMPTMNGIEAATRLRQRASNARVIFLTVHEEPEFLAAALNAGAIGYVIKSRLATDLSLAVREAIAGRQFVSPSLNSTLCDDSCEECE